jgi:hypothetical protein
MHRQDLQVQVLDLTESLNILEESVKCNQKLFQKAVILMFIMQQSQQPRTHAPCSQNRYRRPTSDFQIALMHWKCSRLQEGIKYKQSCDMAMKQRWLTLRNVLQTFLTVVMRSTNRKVFQELDQPTDSPEANAMAKQWSVSFKGGAMKPHAQVQKLVRQALNISNDSDEEINDESLAFERSDASDAESESGHDPQQDSKAGAKAGAKAGQAAPAKPSESSHLVTPIKDKGSHDISNPDDTTRNQETENEGASKAVHERDANAEANKVTLEAANMDGSLDNRDESNKATPKVVGAEDADADAVLEKAALDNADESNKATLEVVGAEDADADAVLEKDAQLLKVVRHLKHANNRFKYHRYMALNSAARAAEAVEQFMNTVCSSIEQLPETCRESAEVKGAVLHALGMWAFKYPQQTGMDGEFQTTAQQIFKNVMLRLSPWAVHPWPKVSLQRAQLNGSVSLTLQSGFTAINIWETFSQAVQPWAYGYIYCAQFGNAYSDLAVIRIGQSVHHPAVCWHLFLCNLSKSDRKCTLHRWTLQENR